MVAKGWGELGSEGVGGCWVEDDRKGVEGEIGVMDSEMQTFC